MKVLRPLLILFGLLILLPTFAHAHSSPSCQIFVNDHKVSFQEPLFVESGRLFVPIRFISEQLGAAVEWNGAERKVLIKSPINDQILFFAGSRGVQINGSKYIMDVSPLMRNDRMYLPIRHVSELLHLKVKWMDNTVQLNQVPLYEVQEGDSLSSISAKFNTTEQLIKVRNSLQSSTVSPKTKLKVVIPSVMKNENQDDLLLLATLIEAEAGDEPFIGQVAVGNVIVNRINDSRFPDTIEAIINEPGQFTPVSTGRINSVKPSQSSIEAAKKALQGEKPVKNAVYFFNKANTTNQFLLAREVVLDIGNHRFTM
ncbi:cell wall hydrolase [Schinkia azotoformans]|uniref:Cell wall hydrolase SleB n=1 Tax=Schinkia azotoformans LMG 9581 TaxID=1131731 RepID=K6DFA2_SCHAZ|nr:stalk domain-containing protein [Schinkia azotoformans]EKN71227.1 cell wall hydrolase SleB [Schinkia azotoformans LMG 9581]MEC1638942.1 cell wall hydrolase [Schinkia azotoformans]MEC1720968.1 cell wall hydrolase [Schinkia azotoformans]MEC1946907.1 cell wall hydrolase [Schinkia azotoformans]MED4353080.1 cell wall hydrolase [Schinkia azotoformans]